MPECARCGESLETPRDKNASGWWRDRCLPCISEAVDADPPATPVEDRDSYHNWLEGDS